MSAPDPLHTLIAEVRAAGVVLPDDAEARLSTHVERVRRWSARVNLVSRRELDRLVEKHVAPSLVPLLDIPPSPPDDACLVDIGSGGGFPGVVLAACRPLWSVHLVEPTRKKALFLERATEELPRARVWRARAEACADEEGLARRALHVTARAVAPPAGIWPLTRAFLAPGGTLHVFVSGEAHDELGEALVAAHGDARLLPPITAPWWRGKVLRAVSAS